MMFRTGQKVVCINDSGWAWPYSDADRLVKGRIYTVADCGDMLQGPSIRTEELHPDKWMLASRFRPVVERKTNIGIFTAMLTPSPVTVDALNIADFARELVQ